MNNFYKNNIITNYHFKIKYSFILNIVRNMYYFRHS